MVVCNTLGGDGVGQVLIAAHRAVSSTAVGVGLVVGRCWPRHAVFDENGRETVVATHVFQCHGSNGGIQLSGFRVIFALDCHIDF